MDDIPVLDLRDWQRDPGSPGAARRSRDFTGALRSGMEEFGFVGVVGHGVEPYSIRRAYALFEQFFDLPEPEKLACTSGEGGARGFTAFGREHAKDSALADLKEFFHVGREPDHRDPGRAARYPPNVWPATVPGLAEVSLGLYDALDRCATQLLEALEAAYDLTQGVLSSMLCEGNSILRALHYPPITAAPAGALRAAPHEDINLITLLCEATDSGLEIRTRAGEWLAVAAPPGQIVVDAGDMLCRVTGGVIPATTHRVVNPPAQTARDRYSLPYFAHPYPECSLRVLPEFETPERLAAHPPITAGEYLDERLRDIGLKAG